MRQKPFSMRARWPRIGLQTLGILPWLGAAGCHRAAAHAEVDAAAATDAAPAPEEVVKAPAAPAPSNAPKLAAIAMQVNIYNRPDGSSKRIGYLRLGATVARDAQPAGNAGCSGGWYHIYPRGYVCTGEEATTDLNHPLARAAAVRPDTTKPMPYRYAFVRAVAPLYLRVPNAREQHAAEFKLDEHLDWFKKDGVEANKVTLGANDVAAGANARPSTELAMGELLGGQSENDPVPFWLDGGRKVPNVSDFKVPPYAVFANRVRRHTGLALIGSFSTGDDSLDRRFAVTTDLRLVPASKVKPDSASPFHGTELGDVSLPVAFVRTECEKDGPCAHAWRLAESAHQDERKFPWRSFVQLSGKTKRVGISLFRESTDGAWLKASDLAVISPPAEWPSAAQAGQKWIDISIENQTLTLWEGQKPVYATLVSTGQDGLGDPKTTKSTITGTFRIKSKHVTATMDSNEHSSQGGGPAPASQVTEAKDDEGRAGGTRAADAPVKARAAPVDSSGRQLRRGEGTFELRDVPYVEYFESGYALHAAYWHDVFGKARSHGCVNLAPIDALRVFRWSDPPVPENWHGVLSAQDADGTVVFIHK
jgi:lipoprotein-anchoring transpeptidase ErfK/SrfK